MLSELQQDVTLPSDMNDQLPATLPVIDDVTLDTQYGLTGLSKEQQMEQMQKLVDAYNEKLSSMRGMKRVQFLEQNDVLEEIDDKAFASKNTKKESDRIGSNIPENITIDNHSRS